ncbi:MAG TPA: YceI family protein [Chloroflexota bacterium]|nr:YceI family protein [Chloroflexota bacterium]
MSRAFLSTRRRTSAALLIPFVPVIAACGGRAQHAQPPAPEAGVPAAVTESPLPPTPRAQVAGTTDVAAVTFKVIPQESKAIFRVQEQLAGRNLPNEAVGTTGAVDGQLVLGRDGTFGPESQIAVDLRQLATDSAQRDTFIKRNTLQVTQFPMAEFVPTRAEGLPTPVPESGEHAFRLVGQLTIHGVQKEVTWDTTASRQGDRLTGTATTSIKFGDFGMEPPRAPAVLSVVDEIKLELQLASQIA